MKTADEIAKVIRDTNIPLGKVNEYIDSLTEQEVKSLLKETAACWIRIEVQ